MKKLLVEMNHGIYPCKIFCAVNCDKEYLEELFDGDFSIGEESYAKCVYCSMKKGNLTSAVIVYPDIEEVSVKEFAHEAAHVSVYIFDLICAKIAADYSEPFAYLLGAITRFQECLANFYMTVSESFLSDYYVVNWEVDVEKIVGETLKTK